MAVTLRFNKIPTVIERLDTESDQAVDSATGKIADVARAGVPKDKLILLKETKAVKKGTRHGAVESGVYRGHGFYAGFVEHGAAQPGGRAQPYMTPAAEQGRAILTKEMTAAVRQACRV